MTPILFLDGSTSKVADDELYWLEDGTDVTGEPCARYAIGNDESVWLDDDNQEVETD